MPIENEQRNGPVQVFAEGLLGFLQLKNQGRNPHNLSYDLQPHLDIRDWMFSTREVIADVSSVNMATPITVGFKVFTTNPIVVPAGEVWYVTHYSVFGSIDGGGAEDLGLRPAFGGPMTSPSVKGVQVIGDRDFLSGVAGGTRIISVGAHGFFLPQGHRLGFYVFAGTSAASIDVEGSLRYVRLPI